MNLFDILVREHIERNLVASAPRIHDGTLLGLNGLPIPENSDKHVPYEGILIVANGDTLANRLIADRVVFDDRVDFVSVANDSQLLRHIMDHDQSDGAYIYDSVNRRIANVQEFNNNPELKNGIDMYSMIPDDFFSYGAASNQGQPIGTKTRLAMRLPHAYEDTEAFQIKRSGYTPLGMGKVTHFNRDGLVQEFFFMYAPQSSGPFVHDTLPIIGVHRKYELIEGNLVKASEKNVHSGLHV